ncbi:MAG: class I SAM-dependent methyltransferase [Alphaproteobacteria bacterium]|nr:class I SAM-dependent methyltransferase [Alphaproteobacteria bacterium]
MAEKSQAVLVEAQFGAQAGAYLTSTVHAQGEDLDAIAAIVAGRAEARVLDLGCGAGHVSFAVAPHVAAVTACDLSPSMLDVVARAAAERGFANIATRQSSAEHLPFADQEFDLVLSRYSAHHWHDFRRGIAEAARVLKRGGSAVFVDTAAPEAPVLDTFLQAIELLRDTSHVRNYSKREWEWSVLEAGLVIDAATFGRVHLDFQAWVTRMRTPALHVEAIRALQAAVADEVRQHFAVEPDGSFCFDRLLLQARRP